MNLVDWLTVKYFTLNESIVICGGARNLGKLSKALEGYQGENMAIKAHIYGKVCRNLKHNTCCEVSTEIFVVQEKFATSIRST